MKRRIVKHKEPSVEIEYDKLVEYPAYYGMGDDAYPGARYFACQTSPNEWKWLSIHMRNRLSDRQMAKDLLELVRDTLEYGPGYKVYQFDSAKELAEWLVEGDDNE